MENIQKKNNELQAPLLNSIMAFQTAQDIKAGFDIIALMRNNNTKTGGLIGNNLPVVFKEETLTSMASSLMLLFKSTLDGVMEMNSLNTKTTLLKDNKNTQLVLPNSKKVIEENKAKQEVEDTNINDISKKGIEASCNTYEKFLEILKKGVRDNNTQLLRNATIFGKIMLSKSDAKNNVIPEKEFEKQKQKMTGVNEKHYFKTRDAAETFILQLIANFKEELKKEQKDFQEDLANTNNVGNVTTYNSLVEKGAMEVKTPTKTMSGTINKVSQETLKEVKIFFKEQGLNNKEIGEKVGIFVNLCYDKAGIKPDNSKKENTPKKENVNNKKETPKEENTSKVTFGKDDYFDEIERISKIEKKEDVIQEMQVPFDALKKLGINEKEISERIKSNLQKRTEHSFQPAEIEEILDTILSGGKELEDFPSEEENDKSKKADNNNSANNTDKAKDSNEKPKPNIHNLTKQIEELLSNNKESEVDKLANDTLNGAPGWKEKNIKEYVTSVKNKFNKDKSDKKATPLAPTQLKELLGKSEEDFTARYLDLYNQDNKGLATMEANIYFKDKGKSDEEIKNWEKITIAEEEAIKQNEKETNNQNKEENKDRTKNLGPEQKKDTKEEKKENTNNKWDDTFASINSGKGSTKDIFFKKLSEFMKSGGTYAQGLKYTENFYEKHGKTMTKERIQKKYNDFCENIGIDTKTK